MLLLLDGPERIVKSVLPEHFVHPCALLGQESGILPILPPVPQVGFLVRDIPVATDDELAAFAAQRLQITHKPFHEVELDRLAFFTG